MSEIVKFLLGVALEVVVAYHVIGSFAEDIVDHGFEIGKIHDDCSREASIKRVQELRKQTKRRYGKYAIIVALVLAYLSAQRSVANQKKQEFMFYQGVAAVIGEENVDISDWSDDAKFAFDHLEDWIDEKLAEDNDRPSYWERMF